LRVPDEQAHHLGRVLRLAPGDEVVVFDGRGSEWAARIASMKRGEVLVELVEPRTPIAEPPVRITLAIGLLKGDQMSAVVRDVTALGVAAIAPFVSQHVAMPPEAWHTRAIERWARIAASSATQCGRATVPAIHDVVRYEQLLAADGFDRRLVCVEPLRAGSAGESAAAGTGRPESAIVFVGPEGGWSDDEIEDARAAGAEWVHLGPRTLRAEIAPTVLLSLLWARWGWT
jgi:16S rRNA (uracil1498-N3)-methyltransferase